MTDTTLDRLRESWKNTPVNTEHLDAAHRRVEEQLHSRRSVGIARKLARGYYTCLIASLVVVVLSVPLFFLGLPLWLCILYGGFGVVMGVIYFLFARYISRSDFLTLPVVPAIERAVRIRMLQRRILLCGGVLCLLVLVPMLKFFYDWSAGHEPFWGGVVGGVIGGCIGCYKEYRFFKTSRQLLRSIQRYAE